MAFFQSVPKGQAPLSCNLCETETQISSKCLDCDLLMCIKCCEKVHPKFKNAKDHRIVDIKDIGLYAEEMNFTNIKCQDHTGQNCCLFCESCDQVVCPICISKTHNGHGLLEISKGYETKVDRLKQAQVKVQSNLQKLNKHNKNIEELQRSEREQHKETKENIQAQSITLKNEVDQFTERMENDLKQKMSLQQKSIEREQTKTEQLKKKVEDQMSMLEEVINAKDAAKVFKCSDELQQSTSGEMELPELNINLIPIFCPGEITQDIFGFLQHKISIKMAISEQFVSALPKIDNISVCSDDSIWISSSEKPGILNKVRPEKVFLKDVRRTEKLVFNLAMTQSEDILFSCGESTLQLVNNKTGQIKITRFSVAPLYAVSVHVTKSNKVIVGAVSDRSFKPERRCIITINTKGEHETTYEYDENNKSIFNFPWRIKSTSNDRICILDWLSSDADGRVVVFNPGKDSIQVYEGHPKINSPDKPFKITDLAVTPLDNVIVLNRNINVFHILNSSGKYITHYDTTDIGILNPLSVSFNAKGLLYIGSTTKKGLHDKAKLYIVDISEKLENARRIDKYE